MAAPAEVVGYLALFVGVGGLFLLINLVVGKLLRPDDPHEEKQEIYECGEPTIGSSFVQFDLRFYVVALLFIIFDVEVAFFFPWATVFGKSTNLADLSKADRAVTETGELTSAATGLYRELGVENPTIANTLGSDAPARALDRSDAIGAAAGQLAAISFVDIAVFFGVLMVGFFYVWKRGDLDWVRAVARQRREPTRLEAPPAATETEPAMSA